MVTADTYRRYVVRTVLGFSRPKKKEDWLDNNINVKFLIVPATHRNNSWLNIFLQCLGIVPTSSYIYPSTVSSTYTLSQSLIPPPLALLPPLLWTRENRRVFLKRNAWVSVAAPLSWSNHMWVWDIQYCNSGKLKLLWEDLVRFFVWFLDLIKHQKFHHSIPDFKKTCAFLHIFGPVWDM